MKNKVILLFICVMVLGNTKCFHDVHTGQILVSATYTGSVEDATQPGTHKIYVYLYETLTTTPADEPDYQLCTDAGVTIGENNVISFINIPPGNYYVLVFYDYKAHNQKIPGKGDRYVFYKSASPHTARLTADATPIAVEEGSHDVIKLSFGDENQFGTDGVYQTSK